MIKPRDDEWGVGVPCLMYTKKNCIGRLHLVRILFGEGDAFYKTKPKFLCKCDKCGVEIILNYNPDNPTILY